MADNAPFSVNRPPFPNVVNTLQQGRVLQHILTLTGADGTIAVDQTKSTAGCTATYVGEGNYAFTFPPGGTGAIGWVLISPPVTAGEAVADVRAYAIDSDVLNFATGLGRFTAVNSAATSAVSDIIGQVTLVISVVKDPLL